MRRTYLVAAVALILLGCNKGSETPDARVPNEFDAAGPPGPDGPTIDGPVTTIDAGIDAEIIDAEPPPDAAPPWEATCAGCAANELCVVQFDNTCGYVSAACVANPSNCTTCNGPCDTAMCTTANTTCHVPGTCTDPGVFGCYPR